MTSARRWGTGLILAALIPWGFTRDVGLRLSGFFIFNARNDGYGIEIETKKVLPGGSRAGVFEYSADDEIKVYKSAS